MPTKTQFNAAEEFVFGCIRNYSTLGNKEINGAMVLGRTVWDDDGTVRAKGIGFDQGRRVDLQNDINAWLRDQAHVRLLHSEEVEADVTVNELVNYTAYALA